MEKYAHITKMESIMVQQNETLKELNRLLDSLDTQAYAQLMEYYYSPQRTQDLEDDSNHLIPEDLHRGVLSEDELFDLMGDYRDTAIRMLELAVKMIKA